MRVLTRSIVTGAAAFLFTVGTALAQAPPAQTPPAQQKPTPPPATQPPAAQAQPPRPFPEGARIAYVDVQEIASNSAEGRAATARIQELNKKKTAELAEKNKQLQALQGKLQQTASVVSDQTRSQLEKEIDKANREIQFFQQDAQAEIQQLTQDLQTEFQKKLDPVIRQIADEKKLHMVLDIRNSGAVWADTGLDLTEEVIKRFDSASKTPVKK